MMNKLQKIKMFKEAITAELGEFQKISPSSNPLVDFDIGLLFCKEMAKKLNVGAARPQDVEVDQKLYLATVLKDCLLAASKNYRDPEYGIPIQWSRHSMLRFGDFTSRIYENLASKVNINLKKKRKRRKS